VPLGALFDVSGTPGGRVEIAGDLRGVRYLGAAMTSGHLVVEGSVGDGAGAEMAGGLLEVRGDAGHRVGGPIGAGSRGMAGGLILVHGSVGDEAGEALRRGTVAVAGSAGARAGARMIAGTLVIDGDLGPAPGLLMKRGTIVTGGQVDLLPTFRYACTYDPGFLGPLLRSLEARGFEPARRLRGGPFRRYSGDFTETGRGEILQWTKTP
jgi:formylmethanofuran dehydrogenase subunit C